MNLEQAIHQRWAATDALNALLPAENLVTGRASGRSTPYATLVRQRSRPVVSSNTADAIDEVTLRFHVWHDDHDAALAIARQVKTAFNRSRFDLAGGDRVIGMRRTSDRGTQHDDGLWQVILEFTVRVYLSSGV